ncbi:MAG: insulinase family protein [Verrucomicrobiota bacterium]|nr:insulinase family protein [Verrucomicrobiota bacterium]
MIHRLRALWILTLTFITWSAISTDASAQTATLWAHEQSDVSADSKVVWGVLPNGVRYALMPHNEPPERVSIRLLVETGSLNESDSQRGLAHFLEHMAFNGTKHFPATTMVKYFQRLGMAFGADTNAHTSFDETVYKLELPHANETFLRDGLRLFRDYADGMLLDADAIDKERGVILAEKRTRDSVESRAWEAEFAYTLPDSLLPQRIVIGTEEVIAKAPQAEFADYYKKWYTADRLVVVAVGAFDPTQLTALINEYFGTLPSATARADADLGTIRPRGMDVKIHRDPEASSTAVGIEFVQQIEKKHDNRANRAEAITRELALAIITRRMDIRSKQEGVPFIRGVAYSSDWFHFMRNAGIELNGRPENWAAMLVEAEGFLRQAQMHGFTEAEVREASAKLLNNYEQAAKQASTRKSRELSDALVASISDEGVFSSPATDLEIVRDTLARTTATQVYDSFKALWPEGEALVFISGNLPENAPAERDVFRTYVSSLVKPVKALAEDGAGTFAYTDFGTPGVVKSTSTVDAIDTTRVDFANNVTLYYKKTDFEANVIHLNARFGAGLLTAPADKPGLALLAESTFTAGGLEKHSSDDLERLLAGNTVGVAFGVDDDAFVLGGQASKEDIELQLQLMTAYLTAPGYREESLRVARQAFEKLYIQLENTPQGKLRNEGSKFLHGNDFRFGFPSKADLDARSLDEVKAWLAEPLAHSQLTLSIVGDFDTQTLIDAVASTFGTLPIRSQERPRYEDRRSIQFPEGGAEQTYTANSEIPKAIVTVYWPTTDIWDISRSRRLNTLAAVLDDRMRIRIREELGDAYSPYATHIPSDTYKDYGYLMAVVVCAPDKATQLAAIVRDIAQDLADKGLKDDDERVRAINPVLESLKETVRNNQYWLNNVLSPAAEYPQRLLWPTTIQTDFAAISDADLNALAHDYLSADRAVTITVVPAK